MLTNKKSKVGIFIGKVLIILCITVGVTFEIPFITQTVLVNIDGQEQSINVNGLYGENIIDQLNNKLGEGNYQLIHEIERTSFIADVNNLDIQTKKIITFKSGDEKKSIVTYVNSLQDLLQEINYFNDSNKTISNETENLVLKSGALLEETIVYDDIAVEIVENPDLVKGTENIKQDGTPKVTKTLYVTNAANTLVASQVVTEGTSRIIEIGTKSTAPAVPSDSIWDKLAFCESGGRWNLNTGNGYHGGLQFSPATWRTASRAVGLNIDYAYNATREEQIQAATWLQAKSGWGQWPSCSRKLGLL